MTTTRFLPKGAKARLGKGMPSNVAYSPDGMQLAVASTIGIWRYDTRSGEAFDLLTRDAGTRPDADRLTIYSVAYSPDSSILASGNHDQVICLWDAATGELKNTLTEHTHRVVSVVYSPDGSTLASASWDNTVRLWDAATGELKNTLTGHTGSVNGVVYSPNGSTLASGSEDQTVCLWDTATGTLKNTFTGHNHRVGNVAYSPDSSTLASGSGDGTVLLWDLS